MRKIIYSLILLTLLFGAISALAQDGDLPSPGILPDSPFYFLKVWKEAIQNFFTFGAENKAKQFLHLADVRLAEYQKMIEKGKTEIAQKTLDKYEKQLNHALQKIEELKNKGKDTKDISQKLEDAVTKHIEVLEKNLQKAPEAAKKGLQNAIENSSKIIEKTGGKTNEITPATVDELIKSLIEKFKITCVDFLAGDLSGDADADCPGFENPFIKNQCYYCFATKNQNPLLCGKIDDDSGFKIVCQRATGSSIDEIINQ